MTKRKGSSAKIVSVDLTYLCMDLKEQLEVGTKVNAEIRQREYDKLRKQIASAKALKEPVY